MKELSFGVFDHIERTSGSPNLEELYQERLRLLKAYDQAGIWGYHLAQHHQTPLGMAPSPNLFLAAAAQHTRHLRLGTAVYLLPFYSPLRLIEEICMLDHLSGGRVEIGVGAGVSPFELAQHRIPFYDRRDIYEDALEVIVKGLRNERLTHRGPYYRYDNVPMELRPMQRPHPALWYGSISDDSARHAARHGMHMISLGPIQLVKRVTSVYREHVKESVNSPQNVNAHVSRPKIGVTRHIYIANTDREAEQVAGESYRVFYGNIQKLWRDFNTVVLAFPPEHETYHKAGASFSGTVSSVRDQIAKCFEESECDYMVLAFAWGSMAADQARRSFDLFATKIMPEFTKGQAAAGC
jgi:alkanesulfonate monooxygenase SsuD/methylene tetrahydromethanopterin reductase-like flavin-dependent oxidoreductase (luciferase family)